jgi:hypothetical protein
MANKHARKSNRKPHSSKQRQPKSNSILSTKLKLKAFPLALLLTIFLVALVINVLPGSQDNVVGRAPEPSSYEYPSSILDKSQTAGSEASFWINVPSHDPSYYQRMETIDGLPVEQPEFGYYDPTTGTISWTNPKLISEGTHTSTGIVGWASSKITHTKSTGATAEWKEQSIDRSLASSITISPTPSTPTYTVKTDGDGVTTVTSNDDGGSVIYTRDKDGVWYDPSALVILNPNEQKRLDGIIADDTAASPGSSGAGSTVSSATAPLATDPRWVEGTDGGVGEYICPTDADCWYKPVGGEITRITVDTAIVAAKSVLPSTVAGFTAPPEPVIKYEFSDPDSDGFYSVYKGDAEHYETDGFYWEVPEDLAKVAMASGYTSITPEGDVIIFSNDAGATRTLYEDYDHSTGATNAYRISETSQSGGVESVDKKGKKTTTPIVESSKYTFYNPTGEKLMYYKDTDKTSDGEQIVYFENSQYYSDTTFVSGQFDPKNGACAGTRHCFAAVDSSNKKTGTTKDVAYDHTTMDAGYVARVTETDMAEKGQILTEEDYIYFKGGKFLNKVTTTRKYTSIKSKDGKIVEEESLYETTNGLRQKIFVYEEVKGSDSKDKYRTYYDSVAGTYIQAPIAVATNNYCTGKGNCEVMSFGEETTISENGKRKVTKRFATPYTDENNNGIIDPGEEKGEQIELETGLYKLKDESCTDIGPSACAAANKQLFAERFLGATAFQEGSGQILSTFTDTSLQPLSSLLCGGSVCHPEAVQSMDQWFAGSVLNEDYWTSAICESRHGYYERLQAEGIAVSDNGQNTRGIGTAHADYSGPQPVLCDLDQEENEGCPSNHYCEQDLCYNEDTNEVAMGYLYYITWGVTAPQDEASTVYIDETGSGVTFNIVLRRGPGMTGGSGDGSIESTNDVTEVRLYTYQGDNSYPLKLYTGDSDGAKVVHMSVDDRPFNKICIEWGIAPTTVRNPTTSDSVFFNNGEKSHTVPDLCTDIEGETMDAVQLLGGLIDTKAQAANLQSSAPESSVTTSELETNNDW